MNPSMARGYPPNEPGRYSQREYVHGTPETLMDLYNTFDAPSVTERSLLSGKPN